MNESDFVCRKCGKNAIDHTFRELYYMACTQPAQEPESLTGPTATEYGRINPEALEDTGEEFDFSNWRYYSAYAETEAKLEEEHFLARRYGH